MTIKQSLLAIIAIGAILTTTFNSVAMASSGGHGDYHQMSQEKMHEHMKARLDKLAERLKIRSSQQAAWEEFYRSVEMLAERSVNKPIKDADAATILRYRAERATEFAKKLTKIADATANLQTALTEEQRKILDRVSRHFLHQDRW